MLAYIYIVVCGGVLAVGAIVFVGTLVSSEGESGMTALTVGMVYTLLAVSYLIPGLVAGLGLLRGHGWARIVIILLSVLSLFGFPIGTALGAYGLWVLFGPDSKRPPDASAGQPPSPARAAAASSAEQKRLRGILIAMAAVGSAFVIMLGTGFRVTNDPTNPIGDGLYYAAIIVFAAVIVGAIRSGWFSNAMSSLRGGRLGPIDRMRIDADQRERDAERQRRLDKLTADPLRRKYAELIKRGEVWTDEQIEYDLDPTKVATCEHLQPIERAMREAGITVRLENGLRVEANCRVDPGALYSRFSLPPVVQYATPTPSGRSFENPLPAMIVCTRDESKIDVVHRADATPETPFFPPDGEPASEAASVPQLSDEAARFMEVRLRVQEFAEIIGAEPNDLPTFNVPEHSGRAHIEIHGDTYHYAITDRGQEFERYTTTSLHELLYRIFRDVTFSMAAHLAHGHQNPGEDFRRAMFTQQLLLLRRLNPAWEARCHLEHLEVLASHPFVDER